MILKARLHDWFGGIRILDKTPERRLLSLLFYCSIKQNYYAQQERNMGKKVSCDALEDAIKSYIILSDYEFTFILPRGGKDAKVDCIDLVFRPENFYHFLGLHYLTDKKHLESKSLFDKFRRRFVAKKSLSNVTEFNEFTSYEYAEDKPDIEVRLKLISNLFDLLIDADRNKYCRKRKKSLQTNSWRKIDFDFSIELCHNNGDFARIFFFMVKDKASVNPIAYNPVSIIQQEEDYLEGHIFPKLAFFEAKKIEKRLDQRISKIIY